jgi:hypothetical protein
MEDIFEDNEAVIGNHKLKKTDHTMSKNKQDKGTNNNLQNSTQKTQNGASRNPTKTGDESRRSGRVISFCSTSGTRRVTIKHHEHHVIWKSYLTPACVNEYK